MSFERKAPLAGAAALLLSAAAGCNTSGCLENRNSVPLAAFYSYNTGEALRVDSVAIGGIGAPNDSLLNMPPSGISTVYLPFRATQPSSSFRFAYLHRRFAEIGLADTLTFDYTARPVFVSEECGAMYYYHITGMSHTSYLIDSVAILDSVVTNTDVTRLRIYFATSQPDEEDSAEESRRHARKPNSLKL